MEIEVVLLGQLYWYDKEKRKGLKMIVPNGITLRGVLEKLGVPAGEVQMAIVNDAAKPLDYKVRAGDKIEFMPAIGGG